MAIGEIEQTLEGVALSGLGKSAAVKAPMATSTLFKGTLFASGGATASAILPTLVLVGGCAVIGYGLLVANRKLAEIVSA